MHTNERREVTTTQSLQLFPYATFRANFGEVLVVVFVHIFQTSWASASATHSWRFYLKCLLMRTVDSNFDPGVADSLSNSREQVHETSWPDRVEMTNFRLSSVLKIKFLVGWLVCFLFLFLFLPHYCQDQTYTTGWIFCALFLQCCCQDLPPTYVVGWMFSVHLCFVF